MWYWELYWIKNDKIYIYYVELRSNDIILISNITSILNPGKINDEP